MPRFCINSELLRSLTQQLSLSETISCSRKLSKRSESFASILKMSSWPKSSNTMIKQLKLKSSRIKILNFTKRVSLWRSNLLVYAMLIASPKIQPILIRSTLKRCWPRRIYFGKKCNKRTSSRNKHRTLCSSLWHSKRSRRNRFKVWRVVRNATYLRCNW